MGKTATNRLCPPVGAWTTPGASIVSAVHSSTLPRNRCLKSTHGQQGAYLFVCAGPAEQIGHGFVSDMHIMRCTVISATAEQQRCHGTYRSGRPVCDSTLLCKTWCGPRPCGVVRAAGMSNMCCGLLQVDCGETAAAAAAYAAHAGMKAAAQSVDGSLECVGGKGEQPHTLHSTPCRRPQGLGCKQQASCMAMSVYHLPASLAVLRERQPLQEVHTTAHIALLTSRHQFGIHILNIWDWCCIGR